MDQGSELGKLMRKALNNQVVTLNRLSIYRAKETASSSRQVVFFGTLLLDKCPSYHIDNTEYFFKWSTTLGVVADKFPYIYKLLKSIKLNFGPRPLLEKIKKIKK